MYSFMKLAVLLLALKVSEQRIIFETGSSTIPPEIHSIPQYIHTFPPETVSYSTLTSTTSTSTTVTSTIPPEIHTTLSDDDLGCKCGVTKQSRIIGGNITEINEFPWLAGIARPDETIFCGGSLIASQWVVTASHCLYTDIPKKPNDILVVLGEYDLTIVDEEYLPRKVFEVSLIIMHYYFDHENMQNDIALLKLAEKADLNTFTPVCLPPPDLEITGEKAWVYGWGHTSYSGVPSNRLKKVEVTIVSQEVCQAAYNDVHWTMSPGILCAGGEEGHDACQGDSGGPLTMVIDGRHTLVGDVSNGFECGRAGRYGLYARTTFYRKWIDENLEKYGDPTFC